MSDPMSDPMSDALSTDASSTERARRWASTMAGHAIGGAGVRLRRAHSDSSAKVGSAAPLDREERETLEDLLLADGATRARGAGERAVPEAADPRRTCFERDRDRILHCTAFRRLAGKTQVFVFPADHQRTRLTHALEVAQVAVSIARALRLNVALAEAIALGHDCGHGPGGHASEDALDPFVDEGYDHAVWGADVVLAPLNLCAETLDGIRNHSWSRPAPATPEGEVVSWADRIAYVCHDFEDAVTAGLVRPENLPAVVKERCGVERRRQLAELIGAMVAATEATGEIGMVDDAAEALAVFRLFNYEHIYLRPESVEQGARVVRLLRALVEHYAARPGLLPPSRLRDLTPSSAEAYREAVTYVGGMTDRFACAQAVALLDYPAAELPAGVDVNPPDAAGPGAGGRGGDG